ncbi:MAG: HAD-IA family hydrolase [gamma proteobacterium symbiont of Bathyaustriella thionipta]|nr:HAD-IA family hydrolase [gamma proteobacterium symbiont of Bathyaustriella thionipta]
MSENTLELIVFDWDGTLMDSEARIVACMQAGFRDAGEAEPDYHAVRNIIGLGLLEAVMALAPELSARLQQQIVNAYRSHFLLKDKTPSVLFAGARQTLQQIKQAGLPMAVATGKGRQGLDRVLQESRLNDCFMATRCADETSSKPHPDMLLEIMQEMGVMPQNTLMVGDTDYDIHMAHNAGVAALAVSYGAHDRERLQQARPAGMVDHISEVVDWISRGKG